MKKNSDKWYEKLREVFPSTTIWNILLCVLLIFLSIIIVAAVDSLESKKALRMDFSFNSVTSQSKQAQEVLASLPHSVHAYAIFTPSREDHALLGLLNRFSAFSPQFTYSQENLVNNPLLVDILSSNLDDQAVSSDSLLIVCEATGRSRVLTGLDYLSQSFDMDQQAYIIDGLQYEKAIVEAIIYVTQESIPVVYLLTGHGELEQEYTKAMEGILSDHHYYVSRLNLQNNDMFAKNSLIMILSPQIDLNQEELSILSYFVSQGGSLLITADYTDPDNLPNFDALYRSVGFLKKPGIVVADIEDKAAYIDNPLFLTPYMQVTEPTEELIASAQTRLRLPGVRAFDALEDNNSRIVEPLLLSGQAYIKDLQSARKSLEWEEGNPEGQFALALHSLIYSPEGNVSKAAILGNSAMLIDTWLYEITYSAQFLLHLVNYLSPAQPIQLDIAPKALVREQLQIPQIVWPSLVLIMLPILVAGSGAAVLFFRRKRG